MILHFYLPPFPPPINYVNPNNPKSQKLKFYLFHLSCHVRNNSRFFTEVFFSNKSRKQTLERKVMKFMHDKKPGRYVAN